VGAPRPPGSTSIPAAGARIRVGAAADLVPDDADVDPAHDRDDVAPPAAKLRVRDQHACGEALVRAAADVDRVDRGARNLDVLHGDLVTEDGDAVQLDAVRNLEPQARDGDADRRRIERPRAADVEDGFCRDCVAVTRAETHLAGTEASNTGAVRDDPRVVAADPEAARRVALAAREPRQDDRAAAVELRLQPRCVVASVAPGRRGEGKRCSRPREDTEGDS
jgi:hypothetical protein